MKSRWLLLVVAAALVGCGKSADMKKLESDLNAEIQKVHEKQMASMKVLDSLTASLDATMAKHTELAAKFPKALEGHSADDIAAAKEQIERKRQEELAKVPSIGKYSVVGTIRPSLLYSADSQNKRYVIMDNAGKIVAYAVAAPSAQGLDISSLIGKKVGVVGSITRDSQSGSSLITFTAVEPMP